MSNTTRMGLAAIMMTRANSEANLSREKKLINWRSLPVDQQHALHYEDLWGCFTRNFGKGFAIGLIGKVGVNALFMLLSILRKRKLPSGEAAVALLAPGSTQFAVFAGSMLSIFNSFAYLTKDADEKSLLGHFRGAIAGALAGTSLLVAPKSMQWTIMVAILVRAIEMQLKVFVKKRWIPSWLHPDSYGDIIIMGAASAVNIQNLAMNQGCFNVTYRVFLNKFGQLAPEQLQALDSMARGVPVDIPGTCRRILGGSEHLCAQILVPTNSLP